MTVLVVVDGGSTNVRYGRTYRRASSSYRTITCSSEGIDWDGNTVRRDQFGSLKVKKEEGNAVVAVTSIPHLGDKVLADLSGRTISERRYDKACYRSERSKISDTGHCWHSGTRATAASRCVNRVNNKTSGQPCQPS